MMHLRLPIRVVALMLFIASAGLVKSQDIHFTLHGMTPLAFNPANTGGFLSSYRWSGLYRDQYRKVSGAGAYMTPTFSIDAPIIKGFREKDWVGIGLFFYTDKSGDAGLTQSTYKLSAAYHLALNKKGNSVLAIAYQFGGVNRMIKNINKLTFGDQLETGQTSQDLSLILADDKGKTVSDHVGGLKFTSKYNKTDEFSIGVAAGKFGKPDWSLLTMGGQYQLNPRIHAQIGMSTLMSDKVRFSPSISYQKIMKGPENTLVVQGMVDYLYDKAKNTVMIGGIGYRSGANIGDAIQIMLGLYIKDIKAMLGYDLNISNLSGASGSQGAFELAAQYIGKVYKRPKPDPIIFCPRF